MPDGRTARYIGKPPEYHHRYKQDKDCKPQIVRARISKRYAGHKCESCRKLPFTRLIFKDGNRSNSDRDNLILLCGKCWEDASGQRKRLFATRSAAGRRGRRPDAPCENCGKVARLSKGECGTCRSYRSLYGKTRPASIFKPEKGEVGGTGNTHDHTRRVRTRTSRAKS